MQRNQTTRPRRRPRRNGNGQRQMANRANRPARATGVGALTSTRQDMAVHKRVFSRDVGIFLNETGGTGYRRNWALDDYLDRYDGAELIGGVFDQYKYEHIEVFAKVSMRNTSNQTNPVASQNSALNATSVSSVIDLDNTTPIVGDFSQSYTNVKTAAVTRDWRRVASYRPAIEASNIGEIGTAPATRWLDTASPNIVHLGYQGQFTNESGQEFFGSLSTSAQIVEVRVRAHISFRGRRSDPATSGVNAFLTGLVGTTVTVVSTGAVRTVTDYKITPAGGLEFQYDTNPTWISLQVLVDLYSTGLTPTGLEVSYVGPKPLPYLVSV